MAFLDRGDGGKQLMERIGQFHKVSQQQFAKAWVDTFGEVAVGEWLGVYEALKLPTRATAGSAGYDFLAL